MKQIYVFIIVFNSFYCFAQNELNTIDSVSYCVEHDSILNGINIKKVKSLSVWTYCLKSSKILLNISDFKELLDLHIHSDCPDINCDTLYFLEEIPSSLSEAKQLESLCLYNTYITELPAFIKDLKKINRLIIESAPKLENINVISEMNALELLIVRGCRKINISLDATKLSNLKYLDLGGSRINNKKIFNQLSNFLNLKTLGLSAVFYKKTILKKIPKQIFFMQNLEYLDLSATSISKISNKIKNMKNLKQLNINETKINKINVQKLKKKLPNCQIIFFN